MARITGPSGIAQVSPARDPGANAIVGTEFLNRVTAVAKLLEDRRQGAEDSSYLTEVKTRARKQFTERFLAGQQRATEGAEGFTDSLDRELAELSGTLLKETAAESFRPSQAALDDATNALVELRGRFGIEAAQFENNARIAKFGAVLDQALGQYAISAFNAPETYREQIASAMEDIDGAASFLLPQQITERKSKIGPAVAKGSVRGLIEVDPSTALKALKQGQYDEFLSPVEKASFINSAQAELKGNATAAKGRIKVLAKDHFASIEETGSGIAGLSGQARAVLDDDEFAAFQAAETLALRSFDTLVVIRSSSPVDALAAVQALKPESGEEGFAAKQALFNRAGRFLIEARQQQVADAAGYLMRNNKGIAAAFEDKDNFAAALEARLDAQRDLLLLPGASRKLLSRAEARGEVAKILDSPAEERSLRMREVEEKYGDFYHLALREMVGEGLDVGHMILGSLAFDPGVAEAVAESLSLGPKELVKGLNKSDVADVRDGVTEALSPWQTAFEFGGQTGQAVIFSNAINSATQNLALLYFRRSGDKSEAAALASEQIINSRYHVFQEDNIKAYMPVVFNGKPVSRAFVRKGVEAAQTRDSIEAFDPLPIERGVEGDGFLDRERTISTAVNSGIWATRQTGDGLVLMVPFSGGGVIPLQDRQGNLYERSFEALATLGVAKFREEAILFRDTEPRLGQPVPTLRQ